MRRTLLALSFAALATVAVAPPAQAVTYVDVQCESGGSEYFCFAYHDAASPYTIRWYINGTLSSALNDRTFTGRRTCAAGKFVDVQVVVTDPSGALTGSGGVYCNSGPWP